MEKKLTHTLSMTKSTGHNSTFAIGGVPYSADSQRSTKPIELNFAKAPTRIVTLQTDKKKIKYV